MKEKVKDVIEQKCKEENNQTTKRKGINKNEKNIMKINSSVLFIYYMLQPTHSLLYTHQNKREVK